VVVVDLVEDGEVPGWAAKASMRSASDWERDGARLVNVAVTRARHRVYLLASGRAVEAARRGSTFSHLAALVEDGTVRAVRATDLLGLPAEDLDERNAPDRLHTELWEAFAGQVVAEAVYDEHGYVPAVLDAIAGATSSIWLWSPWFGTAQDRLLPVLSLARDRGVTVTVFVVGNSDWVLRSQRATSPKQDRRLADLRGAVTRLVRVRQMHQKIVIVDRETMFLGSYNTLSGGSRREIMVRYRGRRFAEQVLRHERAENLARQPSCRKHGAPMEATRAPARQGREWTWVCPTTGCEAKQPVDPEAISTGRRPRSTG
jgi:phosphatidylserine/phosphatidylglycerophosphate/cardiolipin synthase-like enzyme